MNYHFYHKKTPLHLFFLLLVLALLCYWPLTFGIFSAKNDNITQFLPVRFHVSEALRSGNLPLWSPYMYLGYPIHGDMQGGAWNPVVWLLSLFGRYNIMSLHCEILAYVFIGGLGMYKLGGIRNIDPGIRLCSAAAYMMCGYISDVGGSNLPFLAAAAYLPWVLAYYYHLLTQPLFSTAVKAAVALALLFVSAYPSFFIVTFYILLCALLVMVCRGAIQGRNKAVGRLLAAQALTAGVFLLLSLNRRAIK